MKRQWKGIVYRIEDLRWRIAIFADENFDLLFSMLMGFILGIAFTLVVASILIGVVL